MGIPTTTSNVARVIAIDRHLPAGETVDEAVAILLRGGLVAFPTETVYGLGALARLDIAVARIFQAKGRPSHHPLIAHVADVAQARALAEGWPPLADALAAAFWPGPLTLVVRRARHLSSAIAGGGPTIAVRAPAHPVALALVRAAGPIAAPSANRYQALSPTSADHVARGLGAAVDLILDGGPCAHGIESTVLDVTGERVSLLRPGALSMARLRAVVPDIEVAAKVADASELRASPGMDARHYAPNANLCVAASLPTAIGEAQRLASLGKTVAMVVRRPLPADFAAVMASSGVSVVCLPDDPDGYARDLFATLHALDQAGAHEIVVDDVPESEAWWGVRDRLTRGAAARS